MSTSISGTTLIQTSAILSKLQNVQLFNSEGVHENLRTLGLLSPTPVKLEPTPLETIATYLGTLPEFIYDETKGERDLMLLQIKLEVETAFDEKVCLSMRGW